LLLTLTPSYKLKFFQNIHSVSLPLVGDQVASHMLQPSIFKVCILY